MTAAQIFADQLEISFGDRTALDGASLVTQGGLTAVLGPNGAGKSTLLRCLATVLTPDAGQLVVDGLDPRHESDRTEIRRRLGFVPQTGGPDDRARVHDVIDYLAILKGHDDERHRRMMICDVLDEVGLLERVSEPMGSLSGGMQRRVVLAQALLGAPTLLVLDEPASGLDPDERLRLRSIVTARRRTATVIISTHLTDEAAVCDDVLVMLDGRIRFAGPPDALARVAQARVWRHHGTPPSDARATWQLPDGSHRCLGAPPPDAQLLEPTLEDGYLLVRSSGLFETPA
jgi:ABC-2 type transport system ATP-binding protein